MPAAQRKLTASPQRNCQRLTARAYNVPIRCAAEKLPLKGSGKTGRSGSVQIILDYALTLCGLFRLSAGSEARVHSGRHSRNLHHWSTRFGTDSGAVKASFQLPHFTQVWIGPEGCVVRHFSEVSVSNAKRILAGGLVRRVPFQRSEALHFHVVKLGPDQSEYRGSSLK